MREGYIQRKVRDYAEFKGWVARRWSSPGRRSVPDYIFFRNGEVKMIEFKSTGKKPTKAQRKEHRRLNRAGFPVDVIDNIEEGKRLME
tara:strand:+ start:2360 stop:2623 length:264 start_codon:yes stop_codon:yes gene_type:complete